MEYRPTSTKGYSAYIRDVRIALLVLSLASILIIVFGTISDASLFEKHIIIVAPLMCIWGMGSIVIASWNRTVFNAIVFNLESKYGITDVSNDQTPHRIIGMLHGQRVIYSYSEDAKTYEPTLRRISDDAPEPDPETLIRG